MEVMLACKKLQYSRFLFIINPCSERYVISQGAVSSFIIPVFITSTAVAMSSLLYL